MSTKIKTSILDMIIGLVAFVLIDSFSKYVYFDYITCTIITALIFLFIGIIRGSNELLPLLFKVLFINLFPIISIIIVPLPIALFLPIPLNAIIFSFIGLYIRRKWAFGVKIKYTLLAVISIIFLIVLSFTLYPRHISNISTQKLNKPAIEFEFISFEGDSIKSSDLKGNVIILDFWDSGCSPCIAAMPDLEKLYLKYKTHPKVKMFCVNVGWKPIEKEKEFTRKKGYNLPFVYDGKMISEKLLGFSGAGFLLIIDKKYNIKIMHRGYDRAEDFVGSISRHIEHFISEN